MGNAAASAGPNGRIHYAGVAYPSPQKYDSKTPAAAETGAATAAAGARTSFAAPSSYSYPHQYEMSGHETTPAPSTQPYQSYTAAPDDIGFRGDLHRSESDSREWDEKRSMVYMRILSADEFLGRMDETDERIHTISQVEDREKFLPRVTELMGLRGHLQDELLRIEAMLSEGDPDLLCLREFEQNHGRVVQVLRDIKDKQKILSTVTIPLEPEVISLSLVPTSSQIKSQGTSSTSTDIGGKNTCNAGVQSSASSTSQGSGAVGADHLTEDGLKQRHDEQEQKVATSYAQRVLDGERLSVDEMNRLLADHLLSMQALRDKQNAEKDRLLANLERKKRERLGAKKAEVLPQIVDDEKSVEEPDSSDSDEEDFSHLMQRLTTPVSKANSDDVGEFDSEEDEVVHYGTSVLEKDEGFEDRQETFSDDLWGKLRSQNSMEEFHAMLDTFRNQEDGRKAVRDGEGDRHKSSLLAKLAARKNKPKGDGDEDKDLSAEELSERDKTFVEELRKNNARLSDGEVEALLKRHLEEVAALRRQRDAEGAKMYEKLQEKLKAKKKKHGDDYIDVEEEERELQEVDMDLDDLDRALSASLVGGRENLVDDEIQKILARYRKQQESLIRKRMSDRDRLTQKMEEKLNEKKHGRKERKLTQRVEDDDEFFKQLQDLHANGQLTRESFNEMLQLYLKTAQKPGAAMKKRQQVNDAAEARETASNLVQENEKAVQLMQNIRNREKSVFDSRLQSRLKAKTPKKQEDA